MREDRGGLDDGFAISEELRFRFQGHTEDPVVVGAPFRQHRQWSGQADGHRCWLGSRGRMKDLQREFAANGVVCVRGALDANAMKLAEQAYQWSLDHPGPNAGSVLAGRPGEFYQDHANPNSFSSYRPLLCQTGLSELVSHILGTENLWLMYEQIWLKEGGERLATPWHQDLSYVSLEGHHAATVWINLFSVSKEDSLQFVLGSHRGPLFNPTAFDPNDSTAAMFTDGLWPPLPRIEDDTKSNWPIAAWAIAPGDIVIFHMATLHGGAPTRSGGRRRTISLRFFGDHAFCAARPEEGLDEVDRLKRERAHQDPIRELASAEPGTPFRHPAFHKLR